MNLKKPRIVSLLPAATEIVAALGALDLLVGRSHACDFPAAVEALPSLTQPRLDPQLGSAALNRSVRATLEAVLSLYQIDAEALRALAPDIVLTQTLCAACAVQPDDLAAALQSWTGTQPVIIALSAMRLDEVYADITDIAAALGRRLAGEALVTRIGARFAGVSARITPYRPVRAAVIEWLDPLMAGGNWLPELVEIAGGEPLLARAGAHSPWLAAGALEAADPDMLLLTPCGFTLARIRAEAAGFLARPEIAALRAVREGRVFALDGNAYFNRPGPRLADSAEILAEILHPPDVNRFEGRAWMRLAR